METNLVNLDAVRAQRIKHALKVARRNGNGLRSRTLHPVGPGLVLFLPITETAIDYSEPHFPSAMRWAGAYVVETRYAWPIVDDLHAQGFALRFDGTIVWGA